MQDKKTVIAYKNWFRTWLALPDDIYNDLTRGYFSYCLDEKYEFKTQVAAAMFLQYQEIIDADIEKYNQAAAARSGKAAHAAAVRWNNATSMPEHATSISGNATSMLEHARDALTLTDTDTLTLTDTPTDTDTLTLIDTDINNQSMNDDSRYNTMSFLKELRTHPEKRRITMKAKDGESKQL